MGWLEQSSLDSRRPTYSAGSMMLSTMAYFPRRRYYKFTCRKLCAGVPLYTWGSPCIRAATRKAIGYGVKDLNRPECNFAGLLAVGSHRYLSDGKWPADHTAISCKELVISHEYNRGSVVQVGLTKRRLLSQTALSFLPFLRTQSSSTGRFPT